MTFDLRTNKADHSSYLVLSRSETNVREVSQPVKIAQLLGQLRQSQSVKKSSSTKICLPERIPLCQRSTSRKNERNLCAKFFHGETNVRRNLDFTKIPTSAEKRKALSKPNKNDPSNMSTTKDLSTRKSLLLAPNTIKDWHVKNILKQSKSVLPQFGVSTLHSEGRQSKLSKELEGCSSPDKNTKGYINFVIPERSNKTSVIQHTSSQTFNMNNQSGIQNVNSTDLDFLTTSDEDILEKPILESSSCIGVLDGNICNSQNSFITANQLSLTYDMETKVNGDLYNNNNTDQNNIHYLEQSLQTTYTLLDTEQLKDSACSVHVEKEKLLSTTTNICQEDWHSSVQTIRKMSESFLHVQHNTEESNLHVTLNKTELTVLQSNLKHLICRLEEDMSCLKLMSGLIANALSEANATDKAIEDNETKIKQLVTKNLNDTQEVDNVKTESPSMLVNDLTSKIITESDDITKKEGCKSSDNSEMQSLRQIDIVFEHDKENKETPNMPFNAKCMKPKSEARRRSARLMEKTASKLNEEVENDSFVNLEATLNITNVQSNATPKLIKKCTPLTNKNKDKKVGRPLMEYMALKSRMSCLLTPNIKRFNSLESKGNACHTGGTKASLSNKVLAELHNLYADSPET